MKNTLKMTFAAIVTLSALAGPVASTAFAEISTVAEQVQSQGGTFTKKKYNIRGAWSVVERDGQTIIRFSDDFRTRKGPDLKIFLSPNTVSTVTGDTATDGAVLLGELQSNRGAQEYLVPEGVNLSDFRSVLVHCEEFSILWGGSDLT